MSEKVSLIREPVKRYRSDEIPTSPITQALPFWKSRSGHLTHRVRSGSMHKSWDPQDPNQHHISLRLWCGMGGFLASRDDSHGGDLYAETPVTAIHCAVCEGKAIGAGCDGTRLINGRHVLYKPRV